MKKIMILSLTLCMILSEACFAGVQFLPAAQGIGSGGGGQSGKRFGSGAERCKSRGYQQTKVNCAEQLLNPCPYDGSYFKDCCPSGFNYTKEECLQNGLRPGQKCGGKYKCY